MFLRSPGARLCFNRGKYVILVRILRGTTTLSKDRDSLHFMLGTIVQSKSLRLWNEGGEIRSDSCW